MCINIPGHDGPWPEPRPHVNWLSVEELQAKFPRTKEDWYKEYLGEFPNNWAPCGANRCPLGLTARCMSPTDGQNKGCFEGVFNTYEQHPQCTGGGLEGWRG